MAQGKIWAQVKGTKPANKTNWDGWVNALTGIGTVKDKSRASAFYRCGFLPDQLLTALFNENDLAATIVEELPKDMFRAGYELEGLEDPQPLVNAANLLKADRKMFEALLWGRLYGGAILVMGLNDGQDPSMPLNEKRIKSLDFLAVYDKRYIVPESKYEDSRKPNFGEVSVYRIVTGLNAGVLVHESRVIRFEGVTCDYETRLQLNGWTPSVLQRTYDSLRAFDSGFNSVNALMQDASQAVYKIKDMINMLASDGQAFLDRMKLADTTRSVMNAVLLDADGEDFQRIPTTFTGLPDTLDRFMMRLAAAAKMPVSKLFGRGAQGMNATGEGDAQEWEKQVASAQKNELKPQQLRFYKLLAKAIGIKGAEDLDICHNPLREMTPKETAELQKMRADADVAYVNAGVLLPENVALTLTEMYPSIDAAAVEKSMAVEISFMTDPAVKEKERGLSEEKDESSSEATSGQGVAAEEND